MRFNMWILKDWLKEYEIIDSIKEGNNDLKSIRMLTEKTAGNGRHPYLLICQASEFIPSLTDGILCLNGQDFLLIKSNNMDEIYNMINEAIDFYTDRETQMIDLIEQQCTLQELRNCPLITCADDAG